MVQSLVVRETTHSAHQHETFTNVIFGFWVYLMSDCVLFAALFATYGVLKHNTFGGPGPAELFSLPLAFVETLILLTSSLTSGLGMLAALHGRKNWLLIWLSITLLLGSSFIFLELHEFTTLVQEGNSWTRSGFLSSFFTLVGTHGLHVTSGLIWLTVMLGQILYYGISVDVFRRLVCFNMFWHFLDLVWIFIFTFVYLLQ